MPDQRGVSGPLNGKVKGLITKAEADALYLALLGGTMQGDINMDGFDIDEVSSITSSGSISTTATGANNNTGDVVTLTATSGNINLAAAGDIDAQTNQIKNVVDPTAAQDAATKAYSDTQDSVVALAAVAYTDSEIVTHAADGDAHHAELHTVASHSDTSATGAELDTLTDGSDASSLHTHDTVDDLAVVITKGSGAFPSSPTEGDKHYDTDSDRWYYYDGSRSKWLSDETITHRWHDNASSITSATYLKFGNATTPRIPLGEDMVLTKIHAWVPFSSATVADTDFEIYDDTSAISGALLNISGKGDTHDITLNVDLPAATLLRCRMTPNGSDDLNTPVCWIETKYEGS